MPNNPGNKFDAIIRTIEKKRSERLNTQQSKDAAQDLIASLEAMKPKHNPDIIQALDQLLDELEEATIQPAQGQKTLSLQSLFPSRKNQRLKNSEHFQCNIIRSQSPDASEKKTHKKLNIGEADLDYFISFYHSLHVLQEHIKSQPYTWSHDYPSDKDGQVSHPLAKEAQTKLMSAEASNENSSDFNRSWRIQGNITPKGTSPDGLIAKLLASPNCKIAPSDGDAVTSWLKSVGGQESVALITTLFASGEFVTSEGEHLIPALANIRCANWTVNEDGLLQLDYAADYHALAMADDPFSWIVVAEDGNTVTTNDLPRLSAEFKKRKNQTEPGETVASKTKPILHTEMQVTLAVVDGKITPTITKLRVGSYSSSIKKPNQQATPKAGAQSAMGRS